MKVFKKSVLINHYLPIIIFVGLLYVLLGLTPAWALKCDVIEEQATKQIQALFLNTGPLGTQWLGGDGDTSVVLGEDKIIWFFGDTFLGRYASTQKPKEIKHFVHDSVAVLSDVSSDPEMHFFFQRDSKGWPSSFFETGKKDTYFWILSAVKVESKLVLGLAEVTNTQSSFRVVGSTLAIVDNPEASPPEWHVTKLNLKKLLPKKEKSFLWSTGLVYQKPYLYLIGSSASGKENPNMKLVKINAKELFKKNLKKRVFLSNIEGLPWMTEASILHLKASNKWLALNIVPFTFEVHLYEANKLSGPWKDEGVIYRIPEPWRSTKKDGQHVFMSYAPKFHPGLGYLASEGKLRFTFSYINNLNTFSLPSLWDTDGASLLKEQPLLYTPIFVRVLCQKPELF